MSLTQGSKNWRDVVLFVTGLGLAVNELVIRDGPERPTVLLLIAGMIGLPAFLRTDDRANNHSEKTRL